MNTSRFSRTVSARLRAGLTPLLLVVVLAMVVSTLSLIGIGAPGASAAGPAYDGPQTAATGPAYFGPAPNPFPYCENPTYFDPFPENENPQGSLDVTGSPNASVTTNGITMDFTLTGEGDPGGQYPGFFPGGGLGDAGDQPKGLEMASDDSGIVRLSEPLFYTQWVFTDVDRANEGFFVTPQWTSAPGQVAIFGGDSEFTFDGNSTTTATFNDGDAVGHSSEAIEGRVQVDLLGAVTGIDLLRDTGSGQSGFAIGGGCEPIGVAKELTAGPTWNEATGAFDVTFTIRVRNNLPSAATIGADIAAAQAAADAVNRANTTTGTPVGIELTGLFLTDLLTDAAFSEVTVVSNTNTAGGIAPNGNYNGDTDVQLLEAGQAIGPETEAAFELVLQYVPDAGGELGDNCAQPYDLVNQATVGGVADGVDVIDESDDGTNPDPGDNNAAGETDDPTPVQFECPPEEPPGAAELSIVKTVVAQGTACPAFAGGVAGDGPALEVEPGDVVTYCITVRNTGTEDASDVVVSDLMAPETFNGAIGALPAGDEATVSFDLPVEATTAPQNTATVDGSGPDGPLDPTSDTAVIELSFNPDITLTKTVLAGADADCSEAVEGEAELLLGTVGDLITWCFVATNTGDVALTNVVFTDALVGVEGLDLLEGRDPKVLLVGESISFSINGTITEDGATNVATVGGDASTATGELIAGVPPVEDVNDAAVNEAAVEFAKTVVSGANGDCASSVEKVAVNLGSEVTYCFLISNVGGVAVQVTEVVDQTLNVTIQIPAADQQIAPGDSVLVTHGAIAEADLTNIASISAAPIDPDTGDPSTPIEIEDPAEVEVLEANLSIVKSNNGADLSYVGTDVPYTLVVSNAGPDEAVNVMVVDVLPPDTAYVKLPENPGWSCTVEGRAMTCLKATPLAAGDTVELSYWITINVAAPIGVDLVNVATVTSDTPDPDPSDNEDTETTTTRPPIPPGLLPTVELPPPPALAPPVAPPPAAPPLAPPLAPPPQDETLPLAITGASSGWLALASAAMTATGGIFFVGGRRRSNEYH